MCLGQGSPPKHSEEHLAGGEDREPKDSHVERYCLYSLRGGPTAEGAEEGVECSCEYAGRRTKENCVHKDEGIGDGEFRVDPRDPDGKGASENREISQDEPLITHTIMKDPVKTRER